MKRLVVCAVIAAAFALLAAGIKGCGGATKKVAARVNKDIITEDEFYERVKRVDAVQLSPALDPQGPSASTVCHGSAAAR